MNAYIQEKGRNEVIKRMHDLVSVDLTSIFKAEE